MYYPEANVLVPRDVDPQSKTPAFKSVLVTLEPAGVPGRGAEPSCTAARRMKDAVRPSADLVFVPTPDEVVEAMLRLAAVGPDDVVYDLGCGDGRIVIAAARLEARGVGVDLNADEGAGTNAGAAGVEGRVRFDARASRRST